MNIFGESPLEASLGDVGVTATVEGVTLSGNTTTVESQELKIIDPVIEMAGNNTTDAITTGFYARYSGTQSAGLLRDKTDKAFHLFKNGGSINGFTNAAALQKADLNVNLINGVSPQGMNTAILDILDANAIQNSIISGHTVDIKTNLDANTVQDGIISGHTTDIKANLDANVVQDGIISGHTVDIKANLDANVVQDGIISGHTTDIKANLDATVSNAANIASNILKDEQKKQFSTGVSNGGILSINTLDDTKFDISDGSGIIVDGNGLPQTVSWSGLTAQSITYVGILTYISINASGNIFYRTIPLANNEMRDFIYLGVLVHTNSINLDTVNNQQMVISHGTNQVRDLSTALGFLNVDGNVVSASVGLRITKSLGKMFSFGSNYINDSKDPHLIILPPIYTNTGGFFQYRNQDGSSSSLTETDINPDILDVGGDFTTNIAVSNNKFTIQRFYSFTSNNLKAMCGQFEYSTINEAQQAISIEGHITEPSLNNGVLIGYLVVKKGCTDLTDSSQAIFIKAGKYGQTSNIEGGTGNELLQLGNSYGTEVILGSNDNFDVKIERGGVDKFIIGDSDTTLNTTLNGRDITQDGKIIDNLSQGIILNATVGKPSATDIKKIGSSQYKRLIHDATNNLVFCAAGGYVASFSYSPDSLILTPIQEFTIPNTGNIEITKWLSDTDRVFVVSNGATAKLIYYDNNPAGNQTLIQTLDEVGITYKRCVWNSTELMAACGSDGLRFYSKTFDNSLSVLSHTTAVLGLNINSLSNAYSSTGSGSLDRVVAITTNGFGIYNTNTKTLIGSEVSSTNTGLLGSVAWDSLNSKTYLWLAQGTSKLAVYDISTELTPVLVNEISSLSILDDLYASVEEDRPLLYSAEAGDGLIIYELIGGVITQIYQDDRTNGVAGVSVNVSDNYLFVGNQGDGLVSYKSKQTIEVSCISSMGLDNSITPADGCVQAKGGLGVLKDVNVGGKVGLFGSTSGKCDLVANAITTDYKLTLPSAGATAGNDSLKVDASGNMTFGPSYTENKELLIGGNDTGNDFWIGNTNSSYNLQLVAENKNYITLEGDEIKTSLGVKLNVLDTLDSTNSITGATIIAGGVGIAKNLNVGQNCTISGDLTVNGTTTSLNSTEVDVVDTMILMGLGNSSNISNLGTLYEYNTGVTKWDGIIKSKNDLKFHFVENMTTKPVAGDDITGFNHSDVVVGELTTGNISSNSLKIGNTTLNHGNLDSVISLQLPNTPGTNGQLLESTGTGMQWIDKPATGTGDVLNGGNDLAGLSLVLGTTTIGGGIQFVAGNDPTPANNLHLEMDSNGHLHFYNENESRYYSSSTDSAKSVRIKAPFPLPEPTNFTLPDSNGSINQVLRTDGAGNTSWVDSALSFPLLAPVSATPQIVAGGASFGENTGLRVAHNSGINLGTVSQYASGVEITKVDQGGLKMIGGKPIILTDTTTSNTMTIRPNTLSASNTNILIPGQNASGVLTNNGTGTLSWSPVAVPEIVKSSEFTIPPANTPITWNHGLGVVPSLVQLKFRCTTAQSGFVIGDEININSFTNNGSGTLTVWSNSSVIGYKTSSNNQHFVTPTGNAITPGANFRIVFVAYK